MVDIPPTVLVHIITAIAALWLGVLILSRRKGDAAHVLNGRIWIGLMIVVSGTALFITELNPGQFSYIHILVPVTLVSLVWGIYAIRKFRQTGNQRWRHVHKRAMVMTFFFGLVLAGTLALVGERLLPRLLFG